MQAKFHCYNNYKDMWFSYKSVSNMKSFYYQRLTLNHGTFNDGYIDKISELFSYLWLLVCEP